MSDGRHAEIFVWVCIAFFSGLFCLNLIPGSRAGEGGAPVAGAMEARRSRSDLPGNGG